MALFRINTPERRGKQGEREVARRLKCLPQKHYIVLNDLMLMMGQALTQIDHVVVSVYGIFVIETKNYQGEIHGRERGREWTQIVHGKKYPLHNPFCQNFAHIKALMTLLELEEDVFFSIAAFSDASVLCVDTEQELVHFSKLRRRIRSYRQIRLAWDDVRYIAGRILCANLDTKEARKHHLEQLDNEIAYQNFAEKNGLCPRCGGTLLLRSGADGYFYGCSSYPACHYTKEAPEQQQKHLFR